MFKKFTTDEVSTQNQIKSSVQRGVRGMVSMLHGKATCPYRDERAEKVLRWHAAKVVELYPYLEETGIIDEIVPKKEQAALAKL